MSPEPHVQSLPIFVHVAYRRGSLLLRQGGAIPRGWGNFGGFIHHRQCILSASYICLRSVIVIDWHHSFSTWPLTRDLLAIAKLIVGTDPGFEKGIRQEVWRTEVPSVHGKAPVLAAWGQSPHSSSANYTVIMYFERKQNNVLLT